ncbi:hypothetical protein LUZ60_008382 [Juncus effusus]|nr:hypothetical protein LUZ60_008382 [Juncus effusus]
MEIKWFLLLLLLISISTDVQCLPWPFSSASASASTSQKHALPTTIPEFPMQSVNDPRATKLLENARNRMVEPSNCWQEAYRNLFSSCTDIMADKEKQYRLAWHLGNCYQQDSGRDAFPYCDEKMPMVDCRMKLNDFDQTIFLAFFHKANTLCHQLQAEAFKRETEALITDLSISARSANDKLEIIEERSEQILQDSTRVQDSLASIEQQSQNLARKSKDTETQINDVLEHSKEIFKQSIGIAASQEELKDGQSMIKEKIESGMARVEESYASLGNGMERLKEEAVVIEREIKSVGETMSSKMEDLQNTADDIGDKAGLSLEKQKRLLDGQEVALEGLESLTKSQSQALKESRETVEKLAELGKQQQEELIRRQEQIQEAHDRLVQNSHEILVAQEEFRMKQANIFTALDKLSSLHKALLVESRFIKSFFFYSCVIFLLYMLTSAKQTFGMRGQLYFGLCITLLLELGLIKLGEDDLDEQFSIMSKIFWIRSTFLFVASIQILYAIFTYKDYDILNHQMLQTLVEKVLAIEASSGQKNLPLGTESDDESLIKYSWICGELEDEVDSRVDPDYNLPEGMGESSITTSINKRYNLRRRY